MDTIEHYLAPTSLPQALAALADDGGATVLAGGTDLMPQGKAGKVKAARTLLNIRRVAGLDRIEAIGGQLHLGALVSVAALLSDPLVRQHAPLLTVAADHFASDQIRNAATLGGNVCNASPAADTLPALLVHDAQVTLRSSTASRTVPLQEFVVGRRTTTRAPDEMLTAISLSTPGERSGDVYLKVGRRSAMEVAIVGLAMRLTFDESGTVSDARVALASVAPCPLRSADAEAALVGSRLEPEAIDAATGAVLWDVNPVDDLRGTADYRRRVIPGLLGRAAEMCALRAKG